MPNGGITSAVLVSVKNIWTNFGRVKQQNKHEKICCLERTNMAGPTGSGIGPIGSL